MGDRGEAYQARFDDLAAVGAPVHGEADLIDSLCLRRAQLRGGTPLRALDAGCGTGRVAIELAGRGMEVTGIDLDAEMLSVGRRRRPELDWRLGDLATVELPAGAFDVIVMAGNVMIFLQAGAEQAVVANLARSLAPGGLLVAGFGLGSRHWCLGDYDAWADGAGLTLEARWSTWDRRSWHEGDSYAVSVHRRLVEH